MARVALVCDLLEEGWPSMDLVADMLYRHLCGKDPNLEVSQLRPSMRLRFSRLQLARKKSSFRNCDRLTNRFVDYPWWLRKRIKEFDLFHIVDHSYSQLAHQIPIEKTVVTCHDLDTFRSLISPCVERRSWSFRLMARHILDGFTKARHVFCVSHTIQQELLQTGLFPPDRVSVVFNGVDSSFSEAADPSADAETTRLVPMDDTPYLLSVGSSIARKRLDLLLKIFASIRKEQPIRLVKVGGPFSLDHERLIDQLGIRNSIIILPFVSRRALASVYRRASLAVLTSEAEGFGLPVVEAMACGCPVVASDIPVFREIGSNAAAFCTVGDIHNWTRTIMNLLREKKENSVEWQQRRAAGSAQATRFTWDQTALQCMQVYKKVLQEGNRFNQT